MENPRASWINLLASAPMSVLSMASSATAIENTRTYNFAANTAGAGVLPAGLLLWDSANTQKAVETDQNGLARSTGVIASGLHVWNAAGDIRPLYSAAQIGDGGAGTRTITASVMPFNGNTFDRLHNNNATNMVALTQPFQLGVAEAGEWTADSSVAAAGTPVASKAAGAAGVRHVGRNLSISLANIGVTPTALITVVLRDGATGAGTVKRTWQFVIPASATINIDVADLNILGTDATAMTLEATAALPANVSGVCSLAGYSTA